MSTSTWAEAIAGQAATASQYNNLLGVHPSRLFYEGTVIASNTTAEATFQYSNANWVAQPFVLSGTTVDAVQVYCKKAGTGADVTISLRADSAGSPSASSIISRTFPAEFPDTTSRWVTFPLYASGLTASATYWIVISMGGDGTNRLVTSMSGSATPYAKTSVNGSSWSATSTQMMFKVHQGNNGMKYIGWEEDSGARLGELRYNADARVDRVAEYVGTFRNVRTLTYDSIGNLTGVT